MTLWSQAPTRFRKLPDNASPQETIAYLQEVASIAINMAKDLQHIINGNVDFKNVRALSIKTENLATGAVTAEKITVDELSAISADLGHITAGLVEAIRMIASTIIGSYIATADGTFPRCEMSITENLFRAYGDTEDDYIGVVTDFIGNGPGSVIAKDGVTQGGQYAGALAYFVRAIVDLHLVSGTDIYMEPNGIFGVRFPNFGQIYSNDDSTDLQSVLNSKANAISGFTGSFAANTQTVNVVNGIITSVV